MKLGTVLSMGLAAAALSACAAMIHDSVKWNGEQTAKIRKRAAFDMSCPEDDLKVTELEKDRDGALKALGVDGCGKKVTYIHLKGWGSDALWSADTASH